MGAFATFGNDLYTGKRSIPFIRRRNIWYIAAIVLMIASVVVPLVGGGFNFGIEFRGGSQFQVAGVEHPDQGRASAAVADVVQDVTTKVTIVGGDAVRVQTDQLTAAQTKDVLGSLAAAFDVPEASVSSSFIGASWGADVTRQAIQGLVVFVVLALILMALYFRTWKMSLAAIIALLHDVIITAGIYAATGFEVTPATMIGFLTILGYSLYDTVVVFDKVRENTAEDADTLRRTFAESVNLAVNQTLVRTINTAVVAALPVAAILFIGAFVLGADTLRDISLALFIGILIGTYSTSFIAAPLYSQMRHSEAGIAKHDRKVMVARPKASVAAELQPAE